MGNESGEASVGGGRRKKKTAKHRRAKTGDRVNIADLLFSPERDFLIKNNGHKVRVGDLIGKNIVLYFVPLYEDESYANYTLDLIEAYNELLPLGGVEFVFVPASPNYYHDPECYDLASLEAIYNSLSSTMPFSAIPFSDFESCCDRLVKTFSVDNGSLGIENLLPYWVIIDHTGTFVAERMSYSFLFKIFCGAELHPLSLRRIRALWDEFTRRTEDFFGERNRWEARKQLINKWDKLLASPTRDYLLSSNGDHVPISSLKDKVVGLYFCENMPRPPNMEVIKKLYQEAKSRGYDFEIVQINFHYHFFNNHVYNVDMSVQQCTEKVSWLTLPFKDRSCRKLQRIFPCSYWEDDNDFWGGDCLVVVDPHQADIDGVQFEFSGAEIYKKYGIEAYPFAREYLYEIEYGIQEKKVKLQLFFPPGLCHLIRLAGDGFDMTDGSQLIGKRVLVLLGNKSEYESESRAFMSMLKSKYREQLNDEAEENKFEVVYVSTDWLEPSFMECIKDMPWLVHPLSPDLERQCTEKMMKVDWGMGVAAFNIDGELIAKEGFWGRRRDTNYKPHFPFISQDWKERIRLEVGSMCDLYRYYDEDW